MIRPCTRHPLTGMDGDCSACEREEQQAWALEDAEEDDDDDAD